MNYWLKEIDGKYSQLLTICFYFIGFISNTVVFFIIDNDRIHAGSSFVMTLFLLTSPVFSALLYESLCSYLKFKFNALIVTSIFITNLIVITLIFI